MRIHRSRASTLVALTLLGGLAACGGDSNPAGPGAAPRPTPAPTPVTTTVRQGSFTGLLPNFLLPVVFSLSVGADLEAITDWTFATNDVDLILTRGNNPCDNGNNQVDFALCTVIASETSASAKPERLRLAGASAGTYTLYIGNVGPTTESLSYQILETHTPTAGNANTGVSSLTPPSELRVLRGRGWSAYK